MAAHRSLVVAALAPLAGCALAPLAPGFEADLTETGGCGDVFVYARDADHTVGLLVRTDDGLVTTVEESMTYDLAGPDSATERWVTAYQGVEVGELWCNDVSTGAEELARSWHATAGVLQIDVTPGDYGGTADVTISDAVLTDDSGEETVELPSFSWSAISVGWLPG
jgi:hypothetical protein